MDDVTWAALTFSLTALGGFYTWWAWKNRGASPALRGLALTLLPAAAWLTGTLRMFTRIADAVGDWAVHLAFSPKVWLGVILAAVSVALFLVTGFLDRRGLGRGTGRATGRRAEEQPRKAVARTRPAQDPLAGSAGNEPDDGLDDEIAAILKRRGIS